MVPLGERGPAFRPEQDYFSVSLVAIHLPGGGFGTQKFAPVVWSSLKHVAMDGERTLVGVFPTAETGRPEFGRNDRVEVFDLQLTPRIIAREELTVEFTLGKMKEKDYVAGALKVVSELATSPAATFVSQVVPVVAVGKAIVEGVVQTVDRLSASLNELLDNDKLQSLGRFVGTLRAPMPSGLIAFMDASEGETARFDPARNMLVNAAGPLKSAYAVLRLQCDPTRPDWMLLPDLNQAWTRIRDAALNGGDIKKAIEFFRVTAVTSPDYSAFTRCQERHIDGHALGRRAGLDMFPRQVGVAELPYPSPQRARQGCTSFVELHYVGDVSEFGELELIGQPAELGVRRLLFKPGPFQRRPDLDK